MDQASGSRRALTGWLEIAAFDPERGGLGMGILALGGKLMEQTPTATR